MKSSQTKGSILALLPSPFLAEAACLFTRQPGACLSRNCTQTHLRHFLFHMACGCLLSQTWRRGSRCWEEWAEPKRESPSVQMPRLTVGLQRHSKPGLALSCP